MRVEQLEPGRVGSWCAWATFPHWTGTRVTWELQPSANAGETTLLFAHSDWGDEYPRDQIVARLKGYAETGQPQPFFAAAAASHA